MKLTARNKGLIIAVIMMASYGILFYLYKGQMQGNPDLVILGIYITGLVFSIIHYHKAEQTSRSFKYYFNEGFKTFIVVTLIMVVFVLAIEVLNPELKNNFLAENHKKFMEEGSRTPAEIDDNSRKLSKLYLPFVMIGTVIRYLIMGSLVTLVFSGLLSKAKND